MKIIQNAPAILFCGNHKAERYGDMVANLV